MKIEIKYIFVNVVLLILASGVSSIRAQTDRIALEWDANSESDMYMYRIFRGNTPGDLKQIDSVYHPETSFDDYRIEKGVQYYYGIKAVDFSLNASPMSDLLSVAIPKITGLPVSMELPGDTTVVLNLDDYVTDPDNTFDELEWQVTGFSQIQVDLSRSQHTLTITTPHNWNSSEQGIIKVQDPDRLFDETTMTITAPYSGQPPVFSTIPQIETPEDTPVQINLAKYISDSDSPHDTLTFSVQQVSHLQLQLRDSLLKIIPAKDWYGQAKVHVEVKDETGLTDTTSFQVVVTAVDDAPVLVRLPSVRMGQDTTVQLNLDAYVWDVDNAKNELKWNFSNYSHVTLSFVPATRMLTIQSPVGWGGFEYIKVTVQDPDGKSASDTLVVRVEKETYAPQLSAIPEIVFNEDASYKINLNDYVSDKDTPLANLYWEVRGNKNIHYQVDYVHKTITLYADKNWFGSEVFWLKVVDPDQYADSTRVTVNVLPVNDPPQFKAFPAIDLSRENPKTIDYRPYLSDVDDLVQNLFLRVLASGSTQVTIRGDSISFKVNDAWFGSQTVRLIVQDGAGAADTANVIVYRQNLQTAPEIIDLDSLRLKEDQQRSISLDAHVTDPDNASDEIRWSVDAPAYLGVRIDAQSNQMVVQPQANWNGKATAVLKATDPQGNFDYDTLNVVVQPVNDPPQIQAIPDVNMLAGTYFTMDLTQYLNDPDGYDDLQSIELLNNPQSFIGYYLTGLRVTFFAPQGFRGQETFMLRVTDKAGAQAVAIFVLHVEAGSIAGGIVVHPFGSGTVIHLNWNSRLPTKAHLEYSLDWSFDQTTVPEKEFTTSHHVVLENLKPDKLYHYRVVSVDQQGMVITNPDSVFRTGQSIKGINVFPIPFKVHQAESGDGIYFTNLGDEATITIYDMLGELVYRKKVQGPIFKWDVRNGNDQSIHSGLYLYYVKTKKKTFQGKIIIIR